MGQKKSKGPKGGWGTGKQFLGEGLESRSSSHDDIETMWLARHTTFPTKAHAIAFNQTCFSMTTITEKLNPKKFVRS